jgi:phosphoribosylglycinamide formyltransferase-1
MRLGVQISGRGSNLQALIDACAGADFPAEIALVISNVPDARGLQRAAAAGLPHCVIDHRRFEGRGAFESALDTALREAGVDLVCNAGFMRILTNGFLSLWPDKIINIHPSLLPAFQGLDTHARAIAAGVRLSGCTVHFVRPAVDAGPIIVQAAVPVLPRDGPEDLAARVLAQEHRIYPLAVRLIATGCVHLEGDRVRIDGAGWASSALVNPVP